MGSEGYARQRSPARCGKPGAFEEIPTPPSPNCPAPQVNVSRQLMNGFHGYAAHNRANIR